MADPGEREALIRAGHDRVHVETDWYDGPRSGVADVEGIPHYFESLFDDVQDDYSELYCVWPITPWALELERESWRIFSAWNARFKAGEANLDSHPGSGGVDERYDEIARLLHDQRQVPIDARRVTATWTILRDAERSAPGGPDYVVRWTG